MLRKKSGILDKALGARTTLVAAGSSPRIASVRRGRGAIGRLPIVCLLYAVATLATACTSSSTPDNPRASVSTPVSSPTSPSRSAPTSPADSGPTSTSSQTTPANTQTSTTDSGMGPAIAAFIDYITATYNAQRAPRQPGEPYTPKEDFTRYSFDPMRSQENAYIASLAAAGEAFRGTPPMPRVHVTSIDLDGKPYPTVVLTNCPTPAPSWAAYDTKTNKNVPYTTTKVAPPYLSTVTVILHEGHWGVQKTSVDSARTCTA